MILSNFSNFQQRFIVSSCLIATLIFITYLSHCPTYCILFPILTSAIILTALWEFYEIARVKETSPLSKFSLFSALLYLFALFWSLIHPTFSLLPLTVCFLFLLLSFGYYFFKGNSPLLNLATTFLGWIYLVFPLGLILSINYFFYENKTEDGRYWLAYLLIVSKSTDIAGYCIGKNFGRHPLASVISPKKSWEGAIGGFIAAILVSTLFTFFTPHLHLTVVQALLLGALMALTAQFGDLAESLLKRDARVKDSNRLPGLGGVLDSVDSLVFATPLLYIFLRMKEFL